MDNVESAGSNGHTEVDARPDMRICIAGAGAIGSTLAVRLFNAGYSPWLFAREHAVETIRTNGLSLTDQHGIARASVAVSSVADFGIQDLVFLCVKAHALPDLVAGIRPLIGPETVVVPLVNGVPWWYFLREGGRFDGRSVHAVDPEGKLLNSIPPESLVGAVVYMAVAAQSPGVMEAYSPHRIILGELGHSASDRVERLCALLTSAGIHAVSTSRIRDEVWTKIAANLSSNPISALMEATLEEVYGSDELRRTVAALMQEGMLIAACYGARLKNGPDRLFTLGASMGQFKTSMLQDLEGGRTLELEAVCDAVLELASLMELPMPVTQSVLSLLRFKLRKKTPPWHGSRSSRAT
jgi:2-dehydropantoate 2-reductase